MVWMVCGETRQRVANGGTSFCPKLNYNQLRAMGESRAIAGQVGEGWEAHEYQLRSSIELCQLFLRNSVCHLVTITFVVACSAHH